MGFFFIFITSAITCLSLLSSGKFFNNTILYKQEKNFFELIIFGAIFLSFVALIINFFFSLNPFLNILFIVLPIIYYLIFENNDYPLFDTDHRNCRNISFINFYGNI